MTIKTSLALGALAVAFGGIVSLASVSTSNAEIIIKSENINRSACYRARKVPAKVAYNTRGQKLRDASRSWHGNMQAHGSKVVDRYNDEVFIQTREVIEDQHMTLVRVPC